MVKDHSDSERENLLPPHGLLFPINIKGYFICTIPWPLLHQSWSTGWNDVSLMKISPRLCVRETHTSFTTHFQRFLLVRWQTGMLGKLGFISLQRLDKDCTSFRIGDMWIWNNRNLIISPLLVLQCTYGNTSTHYPSMYWNIEKHHNPKYHVLNSKSDPNHDPNIWP